MNPFEHPGNALSRRSFLGLTGLGIGAIAAKSLMAKESSIPMEALAPVDYPHFAPKAQRVIYLFQSGGPSHIDLFDYKPELEKVHGEELPDSVRQGQRLTGMTAGQKSFPLCKGLKEFAQRGESGQWISDYLPYHHKIADKISVIRSMYTEAINHDPGITFINTGSQFPGLPSMGSWVSYGLGSMNENLPTYVVLTSQGTGKDPGQPIFSRLWGSGFLPSSHQGVQFRSGKDPVLFLNDPQGVSRSERRVMLDHLAEFNQMRHEEIGDPEIQTRISQYEMAFRMQASAPELADLSDEPESTFELYGEEARVPGSYAYNCLLARRMAERGVRFTSFSTAVGISISVCPNTWRRSARTPIRLLPPWCWISSSAACWKTRLSFGVGNSAARYIVRASWALVVTITVAVLACGWLVVVSNPVSVMVLPILTPTTSRRIQCTSATLMRPSCAAWASTTIASLSASRD